MDTFSMYDLLVATSIRTDDGCLLATKGSPNRGYRKVWVDGRGVWVHRLAMEVILERPLLPGRAETVDHECHNRDLTCNAGEDCHHRRCIEPSHLVVADQTENWRRGRLGVQAKRRALTHCPQGHEYASNLRASKEGWRRCKVCHRDRERVRRG